MPQLDIKLNEDPRVASWVLELDGTATYHQAPELRRQLFNALDRARHRLVVDLDGVEHMDTVATAVLVEGLLKARAAGRPELFFCSANYSVRKVFQLSGLTDALSRCESCRMALEAKLHGEQSPPLDPASAVAATSGASANA